MVPGDLHRYKMISSSPMDNLRVNRSLPLELSKNRHEYDHIVFIVNCSFSDVLVVFVFLSQVMEGVMDCMVMFLLLIMWLQTQ